METNQNKHLALKLLIFLQTLAIVIYTYFASQNAGWGLFDVFIGDLMKINWNGQFNLDFSCYLLLSAIWIMWRNHFKISSVLFAIVAMIVGIMVFAPYLLYLLSVEKGNLKKVLVGNR